MSDSPLLDGLNPQQIEAVQAGPGPVLVLAGPGSGKTRVLTHRAAYLIEAQNVRPHQIMAVTFTNKAAREMSLRIQQLLGGRLEGLRVGTFHATCARILRIEADYTPLTRDYVIFDTSDQRAAVKAVLDDLNIDSKRYRPVTVLSKISQAKNELISPAEYRSNSYAEEMVGRVYTRYQELLEANNAMDFDDLLMRTVTLFQEHPDVLERYRGRYQWVLVDEFQDTNTAQYMLVKQLTVAPNHRNLFVVGDEDQSIYLFRGADYRNVRRFEEDYPDRTKILLEQNYRSTQTILDAANAVISLNRDRTPKQLFTERAGGAPLVLQESYDETDEANFVIRTMRQLTTRDGYAPSGIAVMYRTNAQSRALEDAFVFANIPYRLVGATRFYSRREIKDLVAYLRVIYNPDDQVSLSRVINTPPRRIGAKTLGALEAWVATRQQGMGGALLALAQDERAGSSHFSKLAARALRDFGKTLAAWREMAAGGASPSALLERVIEDVAYRDHIVDGTLEGRERWYNVDELRSVAAGEEYQGVPLGEFLEDVALVSDVDTRDDDMDAPSLMTLHAAKGLEFDVVFIVGLEEGMLPHSLSFDDPDGMAEERRLMYVGLTRAKDRLYLSYTFRRSRWGESEPCEPSRFLRNIPGDLFGRGAPVAVSGARQRDRYVAAVSWDAPRPAQAAPRKAARQSHAPQFKTGQRVQHGKFGVGTVISSKITGDDEQVAVVFDDKKVGIKKLMQSFAKLEPSNE